MDDATEQPKALWYHYNQNNSGGYCIRDENVGDDIFIQAFSAKEADDIMSSIVYNEEHDYCEFCECCGVRWYIDAGVGYDEPSKYGKSILDGYKTYYSDGHAILYGLNGRKAMVTSKGLTELPTQGRIE